MPSIILPPFTLDDDLVVTSNTNKGLIIPPTMPNIFKPFGKNPTRLNIKYATSKYEILGDVPDTTKCSDKCPEGMYWDCSEGRCKEYSSYVYSFTETRICLKAVSVEWTGGSYSGEGEIQEDNETYGYAYEQVDKTVTMPGHYTDFMMIGYKPVPDHVRSAVPDFSQSGMLTLLDIYDYHYDPRDYLTYGLVELPEFLLGKDITPGSQPGAPLAKGVYQQTVDKFSVAGLPLYECEQGGDDLFSEYCSGPLTWAAKIQNNWLFNVYGVK